MAMMSESKLRRLEALHNRATRYELVAVVGGNKYLLGYMRLSGRGAMLEHARRFGAALVCLAGLCDSDPVTYSRKTGWIFGNAKMIVRFERTERDAIREGEHPAPASA